MGKIHRHMNLTRGGAPSLDLARACQVAIFPAVSLTLVPRLYHWFRGGIDFHVCFEVRWAPQYLTTTNLYSPNFL